MFARYSALYGFELYTGGVNIRKIINSCLYSNKQVMFIYLIQDIMINSFEFITYEQRII